MKQIIQSLANGETALNDVPLPRCAPRHVMIRTRHTLVSLGTERMLVEFGRANLLDKARSQPDKVKMVLDKARTDGIATTLEAVRSKLNQPVTLGYCNAGIVEADGEHGFRPGERVVSNGQHAEMVCVPRNLVARVPDNVTLAHASFAPVAAIGLQGIRLAAPTLGETVAVIGLGLIGLLTVQLLLAQGCTVIGIDLDADKVALAEAFGAIGLRAGDGIDTVAAGLAANGGRGLDAVLITASARSSKPVSDAANLCRHRGRIVLVGVTGLELKRDEFYKKELSFQVSCSYGAGRYDPGYEDQGNDYPIGHVRWTEQRNFEAVLSLMARGALDVTSLISSHHPIDEAVSVYARLGEDAGTLGIVLDYASDDTERLTARRVDLAAAHGSARQPAACTVGALGAGNYASRVLLPAFKRAGATLDTLVSAGGVSAVHHGTASGFRHAATDAQALFSDETIDTIVVATRHDSHAAYVEQAISAGKHVFVEKPLALHAHEIDTIESAWLGIEEARRPLVMVGFNRRFAPQIVKMKALLDAVDEPKSFIMTMNAGDIPMDSWVQSRDSGGGRIIGEACHLIDLMRHLAGAPIVSVDARSMRLTGDGLTGDDKTAILLGFADGSLGTVHYYANGGKSFPKERIEAFAAGGILQLDNFRKLTGFDWPGFRKMNLRTQDKGQTGCVQAFVEAVRHARVSPIPMTELLEVSRATLEADAMARGVEIGS